MRASKSTPNTITANTLEGSSSLCCGPDAMHPTALEDFSHEDSSDAMQRIPLTSTQNFRHVEDSSHEDSSCGFSLALAIQRMSSCSDTEKSLGQVLDKAKNPNIEFVAKRPLHLRYSFFGGLPRSARIAAPTRANRLPASEDASRPSPQIVVPLTIPNHHSVVTASPIESPFRTTTVSDI